MLSYLTQNATGIAYLGTEMPRGDFLDDVKRQERLTAGAKMIGRIADVEIVSLLPGVWGPCWR